MKQTLSRRRFVQVLGALGLSHLLPDVALQAQVAPPLPGAPRYGAPERPRGLHSLQGAYTFFTIPEARFVESAVARLIPDDDLAPGALEAGVPLFIDQQLQGSFGLAAKWYMQGPWGEGAEEQGYQLALTPQEVYRLCIPALDMVAEEDGGVFADLPGARQDEILTALEAGELTVEPLPPAILAAFWQMLYDNTMEGYFADPAYGGNRDKVGWRLVGFPGVAAAYRGVIESYYNRAYRVEPVSIADIQAGRAEADASGHAVHRDPVTGRVIAEVSHGGAHGAGSDHEH